MGTADLSNDAPLGGLISGHFASLDGIEHRPQAGSNSGWHRFFVPGHRTSTPSEGALLRRCDEIAVMAHWLIQGNPQKYRVLEAMADGEDIDNWSVTRHLSEPMAGDDVALWVSGPQAGVYALGKVTGEVEEESADPDDPYWADKDAAGRADHFLPIHLDRQFLDQPIPKETLTADPRFVQALILRQPFGGNPFRLTDSEWEAVEDHAPGSRARGGRNPNWTRDELILALDVYLRYGLLDDHHPEVVELSRVLNALPIHTIRPDLERFRNPNGVALKLANFAALDPAYPGQGMRAGGRLDAEVWDKYHDDPGALSSLAAMLRAGAQRPEEVPAAPEEGEEESPEGLIAYRMHRVRERDRSLVAKKKAAVKRATGRLACEVCDFEFGETFGSRGQDFIEAHHLVALSQSGQTKTKQADLALLCSNCHRMAHRGDPWPTVAQLREERLGGAQSSQAHDH